MSDSDDSDVDVPPREVCESRCQEFAAATGTDSALAMFYLQDRAWDLERSIKAYFEANNAISKFLSAKTTFTFVSSARTAESETTEGASDKGGAAVETDGSSDKTTADPEAKRIRLISWNIDGLDEENLKARTKAACSVILKEKPDVVFLQEVVPASETILWACCPQYQLIPAGGANARYFTAILLRSDSPDIVYKEHAITPFLSSRMRRNLLQVKARVKGVDCLLMTSHLESTKAHAAERVRQLTSAFKVLSEADEGLTVLFGGDLNLRDEEVVQAGGLPDNVCDIWEATGKRPEAKFTWDTMRNDNLAMHGKFKPRCRFDRIYLRHSKPRPAVKPVYFELVGIERIPRCHRFPSDHWGLLTHFDTTIT